MIDEYSQPTSEASIPSGPTTSVGVAPTTRSTNRQQMVTPENVEIGQRLADSGLNFSDKASPNIQIRQEKPEHRIMVYLKAQGYSNREIAKATGYTEPWISQITRQSWFKERLAMEIREAGLDPVKQFLSGEALPSLEVLTQIRDDAKAPSAARITAANSVLDRVFGKPTTHIQAETTVNTKNAKETVEKLEHELASINEQLKNRGISSPN